MKLVKRYAAWTIWQLSEDEYKVYLPEDHPDTADPEFECGSVKECIENIQSYNTDDDEAAELDDRAAEYAAEEYLAHLEYVEGYDQWAEQSEFM